MRLHLWLLILAACWPSWSLAAVIEEVIEVPVSLKTIFGQEVHQRIKVTVFRESTREKAPYMVLNHGRPANAAGFANIGRQRYVDNSRYLVSLGFVVFGATGSIRGNGVKSCNAISSQLDSSHVPTSSP
jgi:hypothetical protein